MKNSKMFHLVHETWNPVIGCLHYCKYCWAMRLVENRLRKTTKKYKDGFFRPKLVESEFRKKFKPNTLVFVSDMGDLFGDWVPREWIERVIKHISKFPETRFLFLTKNPYRYREFLDIFPRNVILGATIETDLDILSLSFSNAPSVSARILSMIYIAKKRPEIPRMVSIEPIMDFSEKFPEFIKMIQPEFVYVGYDNYYHALIEPPLDKTMWLIAQLKKFTTVYTKTLR